MKTYPSLTEEASSSSALPTSDRRPQM